MKQFFKTVGSLLMDQFVGILSASMLVLCVATFFKNSLLGFMLAFLICFGFYAYVTYNSSFKSGFRNRHRITKDKSYYGYLYIGALEGLVAALPLFILYIAYRSTNSPDLAFCYMIGNMYWTWPIASIFPNHQELAIPLGFIPMILIPWIGYIAGYKNFVVLDLLVKIYKKFEK
ncbi:MAG: hypothetical protein IJN34_03520 [Clostridia bacterium]|nr:hypothetical protein [Clostridia bacterium]